MKYILTSSRRFPLAFLAIAIAIAGSLPFACSKGNSGAARASAKAAVPVEVVVITPQPLRNAISTTGTLMANEEVTLRPEISGRVTGVYFQEGKKVRKGELLLKINDTELKAELKGKQAEEKQASDEEMRKRKLFESKAISQEEYDKALNSLHMVQAAREGIESQLAETEIRAPFDGKIGLRHVSEGGYVTPAVEVATMQDVNTMKVEFAVPEKHAGKLKSGTEITVKTGDAPDGVKGEVYAVESKIDPDTRTIKARAKLANPDDMFIPGSFAKVDITLEVLTDALVVPSEAVIPDVSGESVFLCDNGKAKSVVVRTGIRTETGTQVISGLSPNDTLIVTGILQLTGGKAVQVKNIRTN
ncbi:MAG: efflux RND transporter periplasmic adaptor subunit [Candidatus Zixiibacteriota bacterium]